MRKKKNKTQCWGVDRLCTLLKVDWKGKKTCEMHYKTILHYSFICYFPGDGITEEKAWVKALLLHQKYQHLGENANTYSFLVTHVCSKIGWGSEVMCTDLNLANDFVMYTRLVKFLFKDHVTKIGISPLSCTDCKYSDRIKKHTRLGTLLLSTLQTTNLKAPNVKTRNGSFSWLHNLYEAALLKNEEITRDHKRETRKCIEMRELDCIMSNLEYLNLCGRVCHSILCIFGNLLQGIKELCNYVLRWVCKVSNTKERHSSAVFEHYTLGFLDKRDILLGHQLGKERYSIKCRPNIWRTRMRRPIFHGNQQLTTMFRIGLL